MSERYSGKRNAKISFTNKYYNNDFNITEAIVIYPEIIRNNPLNSKYVVRWIMAPIGLNSKKDIYNKTISCQLSKDRWTNKS